MLETNLKQTAQQVMTYLLEFLTPGGERRSLLLQPIDPGTGAILEETFDGSGVMRGRSISGQTFEIPFPQILKVEEHWKVSVRPGYLGTGARTLRLNDQQMERLVDNFPRDKETGEVQGISEFKKVDGRPPKKKKD